MIPLKINTEYSLLKSLIKISDLMKFLNEHNIKSCAICDEELFGIMEFYLECKKNNIKPIIGLEIKIDNNKIFIYAKNDNGYKNLLKINTKKYLESIQISDLDVNNLQIIIPYESKILYKEFANKNNIFIGYSNKIEKQNALLISNRVVYYNDVRTLNEDDIPYLKYLKKMGSEFNYSNESFLNIVKDIDDISKMEAFAENIKFEFEFNKRFIPEYKDDKIAYDYLKALAMKGLEKRLNGKISQNYVDRLNNELNVINDMGYVNYFLIVYDYVLFAKKNNILVGPGRGSAAGALVSYAIGITEIDPIKYDLLFARFLNPYRRKMPDIDIDFEDSKRSQVIDYVKNKYGKENVAVGITFNVLKTKLVLRDVARILKIDDHLFNKFIMCIDGNKGLKDNLNNEKVSRFINIYPELKELYDISIHLENLKKNTSTHAAGVVICSKNIDDIIPIYIENDNIKTGIAMEYLENLGLLKMDFLGLKNLSLISNIVSKINNFNINNIDLNDSKVYELFKNADTDDIFQFESNYAKNNLFKLNVSNFNELSIAIALVRPGPSNQIDLYISNKAKNSYDVHNSLIEVLKPTYGVIIFQEQVMKILQIVAGYSEYEADSIRIAISKKKEDIILKEEENFISKAINNGYEKDFAIKIFNQIKRFAEYGFNKAHSVSYALISYQLAYLKTYYPIEFTLGLLENSKDIKSQKRLLNNLKMNGIKILKPNINFISNDFLVRKNYLLLPLNMVKGLNDNIITELLKEKTKYNDIFEFVVKNQGIINEKIFEILVYSSTLDTFGYNQKTLIENMNIIFNYAKINDLSFEKPILKLYNEYDNSILREHELKYFGLYVGNHPCSIYNDVIKAKDANNYLFKNINMVLLVEKVSRIKTKNGESMAFFTCSDESGSCELTLFPETFKTCEDIRENDLILINGKPSRRFDKYQIIVNNIKRK